MGKDAMVSIDVETGSELLEALDRGGVKLSVALWAYLSEFEDWRLIVSSRGLDSLDIRDGYGLLHKLLAREGFTAARTPPLMILPMADPFIKELRRYFGRSSNVEGMRLGGQLFGDRFVEDAYVYRVS